ncbi:MAG: HD domain-containing protein [Candidatus Dormibacteria bacterium]
MNGPVVMETSALLDRDRVMARLEVPMGGDLVARAFEVAAAAHHGQRRKGGEPYLVHPARVALCLRHELQVADAEALAAALVHDVIEDCPGYDEARLAREVGVRPARLAQVLTEDVSLEVPLRYIVYWDTLRAAEPVARLIKVADRVDNLRDALALPGATPDFMRKNVFRTRMRFITFLDETGSGGIELLDRACSDLERRVAELEGRDPDARTLCPACGWDLGFDPVTAEDRRCACCAFSFVARDPGDGSRSQAYAGWRWQWLMEGSPWRGEGEPPLGWNPEGQLRRIHVVAPGKQ